MTFTPVILPITTRNIKGAVARNDKELKSRIKKEYVRGVLIKSF